MRAVERWGSARDTVIALLPFYAGLRVGEVVGSMSTNVALSARKGTLHVRGKGRDGGKLRELPVSRPELRAALSQWLTERAAWAGADTSPALLLNRRGGRLSDRSARDRGRARRPGRARQRRGGRGIRTPITGPSWRICCDRATGL
jgi:integrase/recombinase XerC